MQPDGETHNSVKWAWMMEYCKKRGISPAPIMNWRKAEDEWKKYRRDLEDQEAGIIEAKGGSDANE